MIVTATLVMGVDQRVDHRIDGKRGSYQDDSEGGNEDNDDVENGRPWFPYRHMDCVEDCRQENDGAVAPSGEPEETVQPFEMQRRSVKRLQRILRRAFRWNNRRLAQNCTP